MGCFCNPLDWFIAWISGIDGIARILGLVWAFSQVSDGSCCSYSPALTFPV